MTPSGDRAFERIVLVHVICTYRRESAVREKLDLLRGLTSDSYRIIVVDNGSTLDECDDEFIKIIHSPNYGGSAGFARGILEALGTDATHILLNDDDAQIAPDAIRRTMDFLSNLPPERKDVCISGIMLDASDPARVYEAGAQLSGGELVPLKHGIDITAEEGLSALQKHERIDYANWTFFCLPVSLVKKHGLPLPMFFREDDVEYGLRMRADITTVPGVYVIHPTFQSSYRPSDYYYYARNRMTALCCSSDIDITYLDRIFDGMAVEAAAYRYQSCREMISGMKDFLKGPDHVFNLCKNGMHTSDTPELEDIDVLRSGIVPAVSIPEKGFEHRRRTLNGVLLRSVGDVETTPFDMDSSHFYRIGKVLYTTDGKKGFIASRSFLKAAGYAVRITLLKRRAKRLFPRLKKEYEDSRDRYTTEGFWRRFLGLE